MTKGQEIDVTQQSRDFAAKPNRGVELIEKPHIITGKPTFSLCLNVHGFITRDEAEEWARENGWDIVSTIS